MAPKTHTCFTCRDAEQGLLKETCFLSKGSPNSDCVLGHGRMRKGENLPKTVSLFAEWDSWNEGECSQESPLSAWPWLGTPSVTSAFIKCQLLSAIYRPLVIVSHLLLHFCPLSEVCKQTLSSVFGEKDYISQINAYLVTLNDSCLYPSNRHLLLRISELLCPLKVMKISW